MDEKSIPQGRSYIPSSKPIYQEEIKEIEKKPYDNKQNNNDKQNHEKKPYEKKQYDNKQNDNNKPYEKKQYDDNFDKKKYYEQYPEKQQYDKQHNKQPILNYPLQQANIITPFTPPQFQAQLDNLVKTMTAPVIYKDYHINLGAPNENTTMASIIYEDALPPASIYTSFKSLKERNSLCKYARSMFIRTEEGEDINFKGGENSLNSRLKLIELNPYNTNYFSNNPYKGLPKDMLIYRSCYPIVMDKQTASVQCKQNSVGISVRVYKVSIDEYRAINPNFQLPIESIGNIKNLPYLGKDPVLERLNSRIKNVEIKGIDKMLNNASNSTTLPSQYSEKMMDIDGGNANNKNLNMLGGSSQTNSLIKHPFKRNYNIMKGGADEHLTVSIQNLERPNKFNFNIWREIDYYQFVRDSICKPMMSPNFVQSYCYFISKESQFDFSKNSLKPMPYIDDINKKIEQSKKSVVLLTESPNYNIYTWASNQYVTNQNVRKQVYTGYKSENVWMTILAQVFIVFYVMFKLEFTYNQMIFQNNFYIKDLGSQENGLVSFWIYRIDGFEYYLPNYGSLLMFDSDYHDMEHKDEMKVFKTNYPNPSKNNEEYGRDFVYEKIMENACNCSDSVLGPEFAQVGGVIPDGKVIEYLNKFNGKVKEIKDGFMKNEETGDTTDIKHPLSKYKDEYKTIIHDVLKRFLHNRVGTVLRDNEVNFIRKEDTKPFKIGSMAVNEYEIDKYRFVIIHSYVQNQPDSFNCYVKGGNPNDPTISVNNGDIITTKINKAQLFNYSENEPIKQDIKVNEPSLNFDYILETYNM